ncbi:MAG: hypothetical protein ABEI06_05480 [Halobacteriaceae archaeon]
MNVTKSNILAGTLIGTGLILIGSTFVHEFFLHTSTTPILHVVITGSIIPLAGIGLLILGGWYQRWSPSIDPYVYILSWSSGAILMFVGFGVISLYIGSERVLSQELIEVIHLTVSVGILSGALVGTVHTRSILHAKESSRAQAHAEALQKEQKRLAKLNDLLRHYILNSINIITGHTDNLQDTIPEDHEAKLDMIHHCAEDIATLVDHLDAIPNTKRQSPETVDLQAIIASAKNRSQTYSDITITTPQSAPTIMTNGMIEEALVLLIDGLAEATEDGEIRIACSKNDNECTVTCTAKPASLPENIKQSLFEPVGRGIAMKFYLANQFMENIGTIEFIETDGDSLQFELRIADTVSPQSGTDLQEENTRLTS